MSGGHPLISGMDGCNAGFCVSVCSKPQDADGDEQSQSFWDANIHSMACLRRKVVWGTGRSAGGCHYCGAWRSYCWYALDEYPSEANANARRATGDNLGRSGFEAMILAAAAWATRAVMGGSGSRRGSGLPSASRISRELSILRSNSVRSRCTDWDKPAPASTIEVTPIPMPARATTITPQ